MKTYTVLLVTNDTVQIHADGVYVDYGALAFYIEGKPKEGKDFAEHINTTIIAAGTYTLCQLEQDTV